MSWSVSIIFSILVFMRVLEHSISRANEVWLRNQGRVVESSIPFRTFTVLQILFYLSLFLEVTLLNHAEEQPDLFWVIVLLLLTSTKIWCMRVRGTFWNLKGLRLARVGLLKSGPYKLSRHPEYWILAGELIAVPLMFKLYVTFALFVLLHCSLFIVQMPEQSQRKVL
ncbi:isoprenylcysteine carboxylmethyltransferase family protein [Aciduricibacillus chroicocephali]|uniref:Isoprenylcysteine carboxylmethyltransferase family protein n=1 Tax=Aciduricibacillus chroicocephali TaxID=3054939 RepID=A0ABY9KYP8_9BACI|nr:isoprenylcysteine carboxylmethyltransferase family protein [Bacillaceae bacterium 44XB]